MKVFIFVTVTVLVCFWTGVQCQQEGGSCDVTLTKGNFLADQSGSCSKSYRCEEGSWTLYRCASGLVFNNETQICDFPEDYPACNTPDQAFAPLIRVSQEEGCIMPCSPSVDAVYPRLFPNGKDCRSFYVCRKGVLYIGRCTDVGFDFTLFDTFSRLCTKGYKDFNFNCPDPFQKKRRRRRRR